MAKSTARTAVSAQEERHVRIKPYDPRRGHRMRTFVHGPSGKRFDEARGWYRVPLAIAEQLAEIHANEQDDQSPFCFDVCTEEEAKRIDLSEKKKSVRRAAAQEPNDLSTRDFGRRSADRAQESPDDRNAASRAARPAVNPRGMRPASGDVDPFALDGDK